MINANLSMLIKDDGISMNTMHKLLILSVALAFCPVGCTKAEQDAPDQRPVSDDSLTETALPADGAEEEVKITGDWTQWGGDSQRNNVPVGENIPIDWDSETSKNIKWSTPLGSQTYGNPVVADGRVFVGTNNKTGWLPRYPGKVDLGCLLAFDIEDGSFLWQHSSEKLKTGRVHDWPEQGICCAPLVEGNKLWFVTSRGEVRCLDTEGFYDGEDDGEKAGWGRMFDLVKKDNPKVDKVAAALAALKEGKLNETIRDAFEKAGSPLPEQVTVTGDESGKKWKFTADVDSKPREFEIRLQLPKLSGYKLITTDDKNEADVIWVFDMMKKLKISQHNMCSCSVTAAGDTLFVNTSNGVDEQHISLPAPKAPSFFAMDKNTGEVLWTDDSPGLNILHGQWSSPAYGVLGGQPQVLFAGGDGWLYSFDPAGDGKGNSKLLWKFDCNPKESEWKLSGRGTRNNLIATPVIYDGLVYIAVGQDPEHGDGPGHLWCIDPTKRGDVSPTLAFSVDDPENPIPHRRLKAVDPEKGEVARDNPNSAAVWHYDQHDLDGDGKVGYSEKMHRSCGTVAIKDNIAYIADFSGIFHCLDAKTGKVFWTHDMLAETWGSPLIVEDKVYIGNGDGDVTIFKHGKEKEILSLKKPRKRKGKIVKGRVPGPINMGSSIFTTPVVSNNVLYISNQRHLFAIENDGSDDKAGKDDEAEKVVKTKTPATDK